MSTTITQYGRVKLDTTNLQNLRAELQKAVKMRVNVGVLASHTKRDDGETNAEVGMKMEYGSKTESRTSPAQEKARGRGPMFWPAGYPARSWLLIPIAVELPKQLKKIDPKLWLEAIAVKGVRYSLGLLGQQAENTIQLAFNTQGFGRWPNNSKRTVLWKGSAEPLKDSLQLQNSISSEVI